MVCHGNFPFLCWWVNKGRSLQLLKDTSISVVVLFCPTALYPHKFWHRKFSWLQDILGGGRSRFLPEGTSDPEYSEKNSSRLDGLNLIQVSTSW